ncbi:hypothetical protein AB0B66_07500 [Catellatospora sp. NPDC049111]|uniref:hypothetical protein n=1 Tax=Catellatospora sp. NPDC049111 TaxID=3155271 RepID=UPI0033F90006
MYGRQEPDGDREIQQEIQRAYAASRAHHWNASTTVVRAIRDRLAATTDPARWVISSGEQVAVGDHVALARHPDSVGRIVGVSGHEHGLPRVELTEGPQVGQVVEVPPDDILLRLHR